MAANGLFGAGGDGMIAPPNPKKSFVLSKVEVSVLDKSVYNVMRDLKILIDMAAVIIFYFSIFNFNFGEFLYEFNCIFFEIIPGLNSPQSFLHFLRENTGRFLQEWSNFWQHAGN